MSSLTQGAVEGGWHLQAMEYIKKKHKQLIVVDMDTQCMLITQRLGS